MATALLGRGKQQFIAERRDEYAQVRERVANRQPRTRQLGYEEAVARAPALDWDNYTPPRPSFLGTRVLEDFPLEKLVETIDWTPFFISWELAGKYPRILEDEVVGEQARSLFADARAMLDKIISEKLITASATLGFWPANRNGSDDIDLFTDESRTEVLATLHHLRQQMDKPNGEPNLCLADYVAPPGRGSRLRRRFLRYHRAWRRRTVGAIPRGARRLQQHSAEITRRPAR